MKVLVTGGAGFLGSNLCKRLLRDGHSVICLDNLYTGRKKNIEEFLSNENFSFIQHDIINPLPIDEKIDWIFNLACPASPPDYQADPIFTTKTCVLGILNVIELAKKFDAKLFHSSTSEIYGDPEVSPQIESYRGSVNPIGIRACYDEGKRCAETILFDAMRRYNIDIKVVRIFNTYGPNMKPDDGRVVTNFIIQALQNQDITVYGDGSQTRSLCYVDDQIEAWMKFIVKDKGFNGPVNIGMPEEISVLDFANLIIKITGSKSKIVFNNLPLDDPRKRLPDITLAQKELGWSPKVKMEEGLTKTIEYLKKEINL